MGTARPFGLVLADIVGLCQQLADAHVRDMRALESKVVAPLPSTPGSVQEPEEEVPVALVGASKLRLAAAAEAPVSELQRRCLGRGGGSADLKGLRQSGEWHDLSIAVRKEKISEDLHARKDQAENFVLEVFKPRPIWDIIDSELLRIKRKERQESVKRGAMPSMVAKLTTNRRKSSIEDVDQTWDWFMIHPQSNGRLSWDLSGIVWLAFDIVMLPLMVFPLPDSVFLNVMNALGNIYWTFDIAMAFLTGTYDKSVPVMEFKIVARRYLRSVFWFDLFLVLVGWVIVAAESVSGMGPLQMARALRTARFLRVLRYLRLARLLRLFKGNTMFGKLQGRVNSESGLFALSVLKLVGTMVVLSHLLACCWYGIGDVPNGWVRIENETGIVDWDVGDQYLYTYQWSLSRLHPSTIEKNLLLRTTNERIFAVFGGLFAMVSAAGVVSVITNLMREFQEKHQRRKKTLALVQSYVLKYSISPQLAVRAKRYVDFEYEAKLRTEREAELFAILPHSMMLDFQYEALTPLVTRHEFFAEIHQKHLRTHYDICHLALSSSLVLSGEVVFAAGDACSRMRFVTAGKFAYKLGKVKAAAVSRLNSPATADPVGGLDGDFQDEDVHDAGVGVALSEAVLWIRCWEHRGELSSEKGGTVLVVLADEFANVLQYHEQALVAASIHARCFIEELNNIGVSDLSDLPAGTGQAASEKHSEDGVLARVGNSDGTLLSRAGSVLVSKRNSFFSGGSAIFDKEDPDTQERKRRASYLEQYPDSFAAGHEED